jgi:hypothetical protein
MPGRRSRRPFSKGAPAGTLIANRVGNEPCFDRYRIKDIHATQGYCRIELGVYWFFVESSGELDKKT